MTTTTVAEPTVGPPTDQPCELQERPVDVKQPLIAYERRGALKAKLSRSDSAFTLFVRSLSGVGRATSSLVSYCLDRCVTHCAWMCTFVWPKIQLQQYPQASKHDDILSGRSRFQRLKRSSAAGLGPQGRESAPDDLLEKITCSPE